MIARGFTLLEVTVALAVAAVALVAMMARLGASADIQRDLSLHALALSAAIDRLERERLLPGLPAADSGGTMRTGATVVHWRASTQPTRLSGFVRREVRVQVRKEPPVKLFLYREAP